ncbi:MAG TPA: glycosyltransferase family 4 protein [Arachidicoccus sp.]
MNKYAVFTIKRYVEQLIMFPFVLAGRIVALFAHQTDYNILFFIPIYGVGGAEYVNAKILEALPEKKILLIFTKKSADKSTRHLFELPNVTIMDVSRWTDNKFIYFANLFYRGYFAQMMKRSTGKPVVFIGQCNFAYKLTPHLHRRYKVIELIHLYDEKFNNVWMPFVSFLDKRLCVSQEEINKLNTYYDIAGIAVNLKERFIILPLFVEFNNVIEKMPRQEDNKLHVYYAGRGTAQKRLWLHFEIARRIKRLNLPISFEYVGNFNNELPEDFQQYATYYPPIESGEKMFNFIRQRDVLLMTSAFEGLPIALIEAARLGIVPVVTPVGEMKNVIVNMQTGIVLDNGSEEAVVKSAVQALELLAKDIVLYQRLSLNVKVYFKENFSKENFNHTIAETFGET